MTEKGKIPLVQVLYCAVILSADPLLTCTVGTLYFDVKHHITSKTLCAVVR